MKNLKEKIAFIIGFAFPMYGYAILGKQYFDLCTQVFIMTILFLLFDLIRKYRKDSTYERLVIVGIISVAYAIGKQILGIGTVYVFADKIMWVLIPIALIAIPLIELIKTFRNGK